MQTKPILFSAPMIRALLASRKTQTRRLIKDRGVMPEFCGGRYDDRNDPSCWGWQDFDRGDWVTLDEFPHYRFVPYAVGDLLWVREAHYLTDDGESEYAVFAADQSDVDEHLADMQATMASHPSIDWSKHLRLRPSIHMPRWASRLTLRVTDVRVQRLQEISDRDALAEGVDCAVNPVAGQDVCIDGEFWPGGPSRMFRSLWDSLNAARAPWADNPWVAAYTFEVHQRNVDQMETQ
ncbi:hypothetical protein PVV74_11590 [Roseovarius sp. SK2]|uniref:hypothetical protein n=1 Tax=Roseovarius TaxID=74030 RepID=UPI00237A33D4|nr:hypothetical protein [Roseovarius sp. SK2]MDD9726099.1 hypothetical protein [Roseovarius sp. SK2]